MRYFVTGIDTEIGKTIVSAILVEALSANYWKPIQSGELDHSDSQKINELTSKRIIIYPESYRLTHPLSPHLSAKKDGIEIQLMNLIPPTSTKLIIEGAGGAMVPINENGNYVTDIIPYCNAEILLVIKHYLGSINHTLLTINYLKSKSFNIKGIIVNGAEDKESEAIITKNTGVPILFNIPIAENLDQKFIKEQAKIIRKSGILDLEESYTFQPNKKSS